MTSRLVHLAGAPHLLNFSHWSPPTRLVPQKSPFFARSGSTIRGYNGLLKLYLRPRFGSVRLDQLTRDAIKSMFVELAEQDLSRNTLNNVLIVLRSILNGAIEDG